MWNLWKFKYTMVDFIHDEVIFELDEDDPELHNKIAHIKEVMLYGMRLVLPDVTGLQCEGALMRRWHKEAEEEIDPIDNLTLIYDDVAECISPEYKGTKNEYDISLWTYLKAKHGDAYTEEMPEPIYA